MGPVVIKTTNMAASLAKSVAFASRQRAGLTFSKYFAIRCYAKKIVSKVGAPGAQKARLPVEEDADKLLKFCCGANIYQEGSDPELKPDSEYPEWLWTLRTEPGGVPLEELDPNTKQYWRRISKYPLLRNRRIAKRLDKLREINYPESITHKH